MDVDVSFLQKVNKWKLVTPHITPSSKEVVHITFEGTKRIRSKWTTQGDEIGRGGFGKVWLQKEDGGSKRAIKGVKFKLLNQSPINKTFMLRELQLLADLRVHNEHFVQFLGWYNDTKYIYISMEYVEYGDLNQFLIDYGSEAKKMARVITRQLAEGLVILHEKGICHRDLNPKNILVTSRSPIQVKITDFGVSKCAVGTSLKTRIGTGGYQAPEVLFMSGPYTHAADMWSLGCLVHGILTSEIPFLRRDSNSIPESGFLITSQEYDFSALHGFAYSPESVGFPPGALNESLAGQELDFLKCLLHPTPANRISAPATLEHPWLQVQVQAQAKLEDCYLERLISFIKNEKPGLMRFFPGDLDKVLIPYAEHAQRFAMRLEAIGCPTKTACDLAVLTLYDLAILIDDSRSMLHQEGGLRIKNLQRVIDIIASVYTLTDDQVIPYVKFINSKQSRRNVTNKEASEITVSHTWQGGVCLGSILRKRVLAPLVIGKYMEKPLLVITITGGTVTEEASSPLKTVLKDCINQSHKDYKGPDSVAFHFMIVGDGPGGDIENVSEENGFVDYVDSDRCSNNDIFNEEEKWQWARSVFGSLGWEDEPDSNTEFAMEPETDTELDVKAAKLQLEMDEYCAKNLPPGVRLTLKKV